MFLVLAFLPRYFILLECFVYRTHVLSNQFAKWIEKRVRVQKDELDTRRGLKEISVDRDRMNKYKIDHVTCTRKRDDARLIEKQREPMAAP